MAGKVFESFVIECRVIDGDSAEVRLDLGHYVQGMVTIRLMGIDVPEMSTEAGKLVKQVAQKWFHDFEQSGRADKLKWRSASLDKYRRSLGDFFDSEHPELTLVSYLRRNGLCVDYKGEGPRYWSDLILMAIVDHAKEVLAIG